MTRTPHESMRAADKVSPQEKRVHVPRLKTDAGGSQLAWPVSPLLVHAYRTATPILHIRTSRRVHGSWCAPCRVALLQADWSILLGERASTSHHSISSTVVQSSTAAPSGDAALAAEARAKPRGPQGPGDETGRGPIKRTVG